MENDNLKILHSVPNIIFNGIITKENELIEEHNFKHLTKIFVQKYSDYNMVVLKTNVFDEQLNNIKEAEKLILDECIMDENCNPVEYKQSYNNMKLLLIFRDNECEGITDLYYVFASKELKENSLKKELNWLLDRETNKSMVYKLDNICNRLRDNKDEINRTNTNLEDVKELIKKLLKTK